MERIKRDREFICKVVGEMLNNPDEIDIYSATILYDKLELYINEVRSQALCHVKMLERAYEDLESILRAYEDLKSILGE